MKKLLIWGIVLNVLTVLAIMITHSDPIINTYCEEPWRSYLISMLGTFAFFSTTFLGLLWGILIINVFKTIWSDRDSL